MCDTESVPEHNVSIRNVFVRIGSDPGGESLGGLSACLRDVAASGMDL
jgi:hypothetical protein